MLQNRMRGVIGKPTVGNSIGEMNQRDGTGRYKGLQSNFLSKN